MPIVYNFFLFFFLGYVCRCKVCVQLCIKCWINTRAAPVASISQVWWGLDFYTIECCGFMSIENQNVVNAECSQTIQLLLIPSQLPSGYLLHFHCL